MDRVDSRVFVGQVVTAVTAADWDDEMLDVAETLQLDVGFNHEDPEWSWTEDELLEMEEISRELEASRQLMPSWGVLFGFVGGFKCATLVVDVQQVPIRTRREGSSTAKSQQAKVSIASYT